MALSPPQLQRRKPAWFVIPVVLLTNSPAHATLGARVFSNAYSQQALANSPNLAIPGCFTNVGNGTNSESMALTCSNVSGPTTVAASISAESTAPVSQTDLATLRASVGLDGTTNARRK